MRQRQRPNPIQESRSIDVTELLRGLWIGSAPPRGPSLAIAGFGLCVFCAKEIQAKSQNDYPGIDILNAPIRDDAPTDEEKLIAISAGRFVAKRITSGKKKVLVTCHMGLNRSALVCAIAWKLLYPKRSMGMIIHDIREKRDTYALSNTDFVLFLKEFESIGPSNLYYTNPVVI